MYAEILEILTAAASLWVSHHIGEDIPQRDTYLGRVLSRNGFGPLTFSSPQPIGLGLVQSLVTCADVLIRPMTTSETSSTPEPTTRLAPLCYRFLRSDEDSPLWVERDKRDMQPPINCSRISFP